MKPPRHDTVYIKKEEVDKLDTQLQILHSGYVRQQTERSEDRLIICMCILFLIIGVITIWELI